MGNVNIKKSGMLSIIAAVSQNGVIGDKNSLLWHISEDMRYFRRITSGHPVIMGRKTFESIGRALPGRTNVVITRSDRTFEECRRAGSLSEAVEMFGPEEEIFIIGGAQIYTQAMPIAEKMYLTVVEHDYEGDTRFPEWKPDHWELLWSEHYPRGENFEYGFRFEEYKRVKY